MGLKVQRTAMPRLETLNDSGGEGIIYRLPGYAVPGRRGPFVYKAYRPHVLVGNEVALEPSIDRLVNAYEAAPGKFRSVIDEISAWPVATVVTAGGASGFIMRELGPEFLGHQRRPDGTQLRIERLERWLTSETKIRRVGLAPFTEDGRKRLVRRMLFYLAMVHSMDWIVGDISAGNVMAHVPSDAQSQSCTPLFVEVDTYRRVDGGSAMPQRNTFDYIPPELKKWVIEAKRLEARGATTHEIARAKSKARIQTKSTDVYKAALLVLRLYDEGAAPTMAVYQDSSTSHLSRVYGASVLQQLAAAVKASNPEDRPTMNELFDAFRK